MPDIVNQYRIITGGAGWLDRSARARLRFEGADRVGFLQGLLTNDVTALEAGRGLYAAYLTPQGRMVTDLRLYDRGDWLLAEVGAGRAADFVDRFDGLVFAEDVRVSDASTTLAQLSIIGVEAPVRLARALDLDVGSLSGLAAFAQLDVAGGFMARTDDCDWPSYDVFVSADGRDATASALEAVGIEAISEELAEALRVEAGRPAFGPELTEETIPLEAGLRDRAISTSKGCYVGQEVIIRILDRGGGRVARRLARLDFDPALTTPPEAGAPIRAEGRDAGRLTSVAFSPKHERVIALGYLSRDAVDAKAPVEVDVGGTTVPAEVTVLV